VNLENILKANSGYTNGPDLRSLLLAIRTALEVSGDLRNAHSAPIKSVRELSVGELSQLIDATKQELNARVTRYRAGVTALPSKVSA